MQTRLNDRAYYRQRLCACGQERLLWASADGWQKKDKRVCGNFRTHERRSCEVFLEASRTSVKARPEDGRLLLLLVVAGAKAIDACHFRRFLVVTRGAVPGCFCFAPKAGEKRNGRLIFVLPRAAHFRSALPEPLAWPRLAVTHTQAPCVEALVYEAR